MNDTTTISTDHSYSSTKDLAGLKFVDKSNTFYIEVTDDGGVIDTVFLHIPFTSTGKNVSVPLGPEFVSVTHRKFSLTLDVFEYNHWQLTKSENTWAWARLVMENDQVPSKVGQTGIVYSHIFYTSKINAFIGRILIKAMVQPIFIYRTGSVLSLAYQVRVINPPNK